MARVCRRVRTTESTSARSSADSGCQLFSRGADHERGKSSFGLTAAILAARLGGILSGPPCRPGTPPPGGITFRIPLPPAGGGETGPAVAGAEARGCRGGGDLVAVADGPGAGIGESDDAGLVPSEESVETVDPSVDVPFPPSLLVAPLSPFERDESCPTASSVNTAVGWSTCSAAVRPSIALAPSAPAGDSVRGAPGRSRRSDACSSVRSRWGCCESSASCSMPCCTGAVESPLLVVLSAMALDRVPTSAESLRSPSTGFAALGSASASPSALDGGVLARVPGVDAASEGEGEAREESGDDERDDGDGESESSESRVDDMRSYTRSPLRKLAEAEVRRALRSPLSSLSRCSMPCRPPASASGRWPTGLISFTSCADISTARPAPGGRQGRDGLPPPPHRRVLRLGTDGGQLTRADYGRVATAPRDSVHARPRELPHDLRAHSDTLWLAPLALVQ